MATDFWSSSHYLRWMVDRASIKHARSTDLAYLDNHERGGEVFDFLNIYFANAISKLGRKLSLRQRVIATATVFFKRFYLKNAYCETDPFLVIAACCYLAAKAEECPVSIKVVASEAKAVFSQEMYNVKSTLFDHTRIAEMEFYLVDDLECDLTVFHPYRTLTALCKPDPSSTGGSSSSATAATATATPHSTPSIPIMPDLSEPEEGEAEEDNFFSFPPTHSAHTLSSSATQPVTQDAEDDEPRCWGTGAGQLQLPDGGFQHAWFIINDTYRSNLCLIHPPHLIAIAAICLTVVFHPPTRMEIEPHLKKRSSGDPPPPQNSPDTPPDTILTFLASLNVSFPLITTVMQEIISLWTLWDRYKEDATDATTTAANTQSGTSSSSVKRLGAKGGLGMASSSTLSTTNLTPTPGTEDTPASTSTPKSDGLTGAAEDASLIVTPAMLSNLLVKMRDARMAGLVKAGFNFEPVSSGGSTPGGGTVVGSAIGIGKAANKMLERTQAAG